ncbi:hypothetical protein ABIB62_002478 [Mucilaginibacter sp. UYP25]|uniref:hypothetical protein n=1 Tax=unclassified Mucilaginibacter TaxID=2617802 RepID=UPI0033915CCC
MKDIHFYFDDMLVGQDGLELSEDIIRLQREFDDAEFNKAYMLVDESVKNRDLQILCYDTFI